MKFRKHFDYDVDQASDESGVSFKGLVSLTLQSQAEDADINVIVDRYGLTGRMPENPRIPMFGDFTGIVDYQSALNAVGAAADGFMELPAKVRARFENNPQKLMEFVADDANIKEAQDLGLLKIKEGVDVTGKSGPERGPAGSGAGGPSAEAGGAQYADPSVKPASAGGGAKPA